MSARSGFAKDMSMVVVNYEASFFWCGWRYGGMEEVLQQQGKANMFWRGSSM